MVAVEVIDAAEPGEEMPSTALKSQRLVKLVNPLTGTSSGTEMSPLTCKKTLLKGENLLHFFRFI